jgi:hypothetical protein
MPDDETVKPDDDVERLQAEVERLRSENQRLQSEVAHEPTTPGSAAAHEPRHRARWIASTVLIIVGSLLVPVSVVSLWLDRTVTDSARYVDTVAPLARDPEIQKAVAARLEQALYKNVDIESEVQKVLPDRATVLAAPITTGIKTLVGDLIDRAVKSDRFAELWVTANRAAQKQVVSVLTNSSGKKGVVQIDLTGTAKEVSSRLSGLGVPFFSNLGSEPVTFDVFQSQEVAQVQQAFNLFDKLALVLPWLTLFILGAGVLVAPKRRKALVWAATGWVLGASLLLIAVAIGRALYLNALPTGASIPANRVFYDTISRFLRGGGRTVVVMGLVVLVVALVTGPSAPAVRLRDSAARLLGSAGAGADERGVDFGPVGAFVARNLMALRVAVGVLALIVFLALDQPSAGTVLWIAVLGLLALAVIEVVGRAGEHHALADADPDAGTAATTPDDDATAGDQSAVSGATS